MKKMFGILCSCTAIMSYLAIISCYCRYRKCLSRCQCIRRPDDHHTAQFDVSYLFPVSRDGWQKGFYKKTLIIISLCAILIGGMLPVFSMKALSFF